MPNDLVETFIFETSRFSPNNRIPNKKLEEEFTKYKNKMGIDITNTELDDNRKYLDKCSYVQKGTLYIQEEKFMYEGFYGLALKIDNQNIRKTISVTGKKVQKVDYKTDTVLNTCHTIAKATQEEQLSASKMSRCIKNKIIINECYYLS